MAGNPVNGTDPSGLILGGTWKAIKHVASTAVKDGGTAAVGGAVAGCAIASSVTAGTGCLAGGGSLATAGALGGAAYGTGRGIGEVIKGDDD